ncbi:UNVERIFIED_CONTAM: hypothetical protein Sindi_1422500 [Sesamum indicum]
MTSLDLNQQPLCIEYPNLDVDFELKSGLIHLLPIFRGLAGLSEANRNLVDAASGGALYDKTPTEARKLITTMAANNQQFESTKHADAVGGFFGQQQRRHDPFFNTYNPGWRDHPNLRYDNQPQNFQRVPHQPPPSPPQTNPNNGTPLEDIVKTLALSTQQFQQETRLSIQNLESQISHLASSVSRLESQGKFPSQTIINPKQNVSAITLCSEKELQLENSTRRGHAQQGKTEDAFEIPPKEIEKPNQVSEDNSKLFMSKPPFPERLAKSKEEEEEKDILETLLNVEVNIPLLNAIKQVPRYAKFLKELCTNKSKLRDNERVSMGENVSAILQRKLPPKCNDPGTFSIPCKIEKIGIEKAMCDLGASINIMPLTIYESLNVGPLKETGVIFQLADHSVVYPEGVLEDVLVQVNELVFPADFYVLDMREDISLNSTSILLGRPFLKTSKNQN